MSALTLMFGNSVVAIEDERQHEQDRHDDGGHDVEPRPVHPGPEDILVVAQQQQEHGGARQQHAGKRLDAGGDRPSGAPGMRTIPAATTTMPVNVP